MSKIGKIIYYSVVVVLVIAFLVWLFGIDEYSGSGFGLFLGAAFAIIALLGVIVSSVLYIKDNPKTAVNMLVGAGVIVVLGLITYAFAPGLITDHHIKYEMESVTKSKMVDMGLYVTITLSVVAVISILASEAVALIKH
jgi:hypothetical protein